MLRELANADAVALHKVYCNEEATRQLSFEPRSMEQVEGIIKAAMQSATAEPRTEYMLAVAGNDEELIGSARLATGEYEMAQIGFALRPDQWGQGKGLETVRLLHLAG
jgi:[ribosomal protein S5]-alanine N-acetyltransferase